MKEFDMENKELTEIESQICDVVAVLRVLTEYCEYNEQFGVGIILGYSHDKLMNTLYKVNSLL